MAGGLESLLRDQGRGVVGALIVSIELLYTMEMWWHGWQLPAVWLVIYAVIGLGGVLAITRAVGFRESEAEHRRSLRTALSELTELLLQSFVTAYAVLLLFGIVDLGDSPLLVARLGLLFVVPLGFGAALANDLLRASDEGEVKADRPILERLGVFAIGATFVTMTLAPTDEMPLMAAYAGWSRLGLVLVLSVLVAYLVLFELEFRGHGARTAGRTLAGQVGHSLIAYTVGLVVAAALLAALGLFRGASVSVWIQMTLVLGLPAAIGASGASVVLG